MRSGPAKTRERHEIHEELSPNFPTMHYAQVV